MHRRAHTHTLGTDLSFFASDAKKPLRTTKQPAFTDLYSPELHLRSLMLAVLKDCSLPQVWHDAGHKQRCETAAAMWCWWRTWEARCPLLGPQTCLPCSILSQLTGLCTVGGSACSLCLASRGWRHQRRLLHFLRWTRTLAASARRQIQQHRYTLQGT